MPISLHDARTVELGLEQASDIASSYLMLVTVTLEFARDCFGGSRSSSKVARVGTFERKSNHANREPRAQ